MKLFILFISLNLFSLTFVQAQTSEISQIENLKILAEQGDAKAQYNLGLMYYDGKEVAQNYEIALDLFQKSAKQGNAIAQLGVGIMYRSGKGVPQNNKLASDWYLKAALQGNAQAQYNLGFMYYKGEGVPQNFLYAYAYANLAAASSGSKLAISLRNLLQDDYFSQQELLQAQNLSIEIFNQIEQN